MHLKFLCKESESECDISVGINLLPDQKQTETHLTDTSSEDIHNVINEEDSDRYLKFLEECDGK